MHACMIIWEHVIVLIKIFRLFFVVVVQIASYPGHFPLLRGLGTRLVVQSNLDATSSEWGFCVPTEVSNQ